MDHSDIGKVVHIFPHIRKFSVLSTQLCHEFKTALQENIFKLFFEGSTIALRAHIIHGCIGRWEEARVGNHVPD
jgi:hypothetical protein